MADAFNPLLANSTARMGQELDAQTAKKKRFMDLLNQGITSAATLKQQDMSNNAAIERQQISDQNALAKQEADYKLKQQEFDHQQGSIKNVVDIQASAVKMFTDANGIVDHNKVNEYVRTALSHSNDPNIRAMASPQNAAEAAQFSSTPATPTVAPVQAPSFEDSGSLPSNGVVPPPTPAAGISSRSLIKNYEGFSPTPYSDHKGMSVGYGSTRNLDGSPVQQGRKYAPEELNAMFERDVADTEEKIGQLIKVPLSPIQKSVITSLAYNVGVPAVANSTLLKKLNSGDVAAAASELDKWVYASGKVNPGLVSRRAKEKELFLSGSQVTMAPEVPKTEGPAPAKEYPATPFSIFDQAGLKRYNDTLDAELAQKKSVTVKNEADAALAASQTLAAKNNSDLAATYINVKEGEPVVDDIGTPLMTTVMESDVGQFSPSSSSGMYGVTNSKAFSPTPQEKEVPYLANRNLVSAKKTIYNKLLGSATEKNEVTSAMEGLELSRADMAGFNQSAQELLGSLNKNDKVNWKADTLNYLATMTNSAALAEISWAEQFANLPKDKQTQSTALVYNMLGNLSAYARLKGEKGVISDGDVIRYTQLLVSAGSSGKLNRQKMITLVNEFNSNIATKAAMYGKNDMANRAIKTANYARRMDGRSSWEYGEEGFGVRQANGSTTYYPTMGAGGGGGGGATSNTTKGTRGLI